MFFYLITDYDILENLKNLMNPYKMYSNLMMSHRGIGLFMIVQPRAHPSPGAVTV